MKLQNHGLYDAPRYSKTMREYMCGKTRKVTVDGHRTKSGNLQVTVSKNQGPAILLTGMDPFHCPHHPIRLTGVEGGRNARARRMRLVCFCLTIVGLVGESLLQPPGRDGASTS